MIDNKKHYYNKSLELLHIDKQLQQDNFIYIIGTYLDKIQLNTILKFELLEHNIQLVEG